MLIKASDADTTKQKWLIKPASFIHQMILNSTCLYVVCFLNVSDEQLDIKHFVLHMKTIISYSAACTLVFRVTRNSLTCEFYHSLTLV